MLTLFLALAIAAQPTAAPPATALPSPERRQELLFEAARLGRTDLVGPLVESGVDIDAYEPRGSPPPLQSIWLERSSSAYLGGVSSFAIAALP